MNPASQEVLTGVQQRAAELIKFAAEKFKLRLDYTEASIPRVEQALAEIHKHIGTKATENKAAIVKLSNGFGSYVGEILRRKHGGTWRVNLPDFPAGVEGLDVNGAIISPMQHVFLRITKGAQFNIEEFYKKAETVILQRRSAGAPQSSTEAGAADPAVDMRKKAAEAVLDAQQLFRITLDYSESSLDPLDEALSRLHNLLTDKVPESERLSADEKFLLKPVAAFRYVAYLGEVFCRSLGGEWRNNIPGCRPEFVGVVLGGKLIDPREMVVNCINDPQSWSAKNYYLDQKRTHEVNGAMSGAQSFDDRMVICAKEAISIARDRYGITLDFSEASVKELETLLAGIHNSLPKPDDSSRPSDQWITSISVTFGAYLGEVFRKNLGGSWLQQNPTAPGSLPALNIGGNVLTPCRKVSKRILDGPGENVAFFYSAACQIIREKSPTTKR
jgi:hypothetical protein